MNEKEKELLFLDPLSYFEYKYDIPKDEDIDNPAYYPIYDDIFNRLIRYVDIHGGRGAAKSYEVGKLIVLLLSCLPFCRILGIRQIHNTIKGSLFQEVLDYIEEWEMEDFFYVTKVPMHIEHIESGNYIMFKGLDKPYSVKSLKEITHAVIEEAIQLKTYDSFDKVDKSVRSIKAHAKKIYIVHNTDDPEHFINTVWHDEKTRDDNKVSKTLFLHTTHLDNKYLDQEYRDLLESDKETNPDRYNADCLGKWVKLKLEGLFYSQFESVYKIVEDGLKGRVYNKSLSLYLGFDFNVKPYITLTIQCLNYTESTNTLEFCTIDEICISKNTLPSVTCIEFIKRYNDHLGDVIIMGDRSGHSKKTSGVTDYSTVFLTLQRTPDGYGAMNNDVYSDPYPDYEKYNCQFKLIDATVKTQNVALEARRIFFERLHSKQIFILPPTASGGGRNSSNKRRPLNVLYKNATVLQKVDSDCQETCLDYYEVQTDPIKGGKSERNLNRTHTSDSIDYVAAEVFEPEMQMIVAELKSNLRRAK